MASLFTKDTLPKSAQDAIRQFDERFNSLIAAGPAPSWADRFFESTDTPITTFPLSTFTSGFRETKEESGRYRGLDGKTFDIGVVEYDDGYEAKVADIIANVFAWKRFGEAPGEFVKSEAKLRAKSLAALLEAGTTTACKYDGKNFFSTQHLCDPINPDSTQWSNYQSSAKQPTIANIEAECTAMEGAVLDVNGDKMEVEPTEIWLPTAKYRPVSNLLSAAFINGGDTNTMAGKLKPVHVPQLNDVDDWMLVDGNLLASYQPMVSMKCTLFDAQLGERWLDETSDFFKKLGKIAVSRHVWNGAALLFPHAIRLIRGA